ncbi:MAG: hypothetical protein JXP34_15205 [Planctomycetes bacterium]|nr:hypothetical protein [Planctomycetota bacterium]
MTFPKRLSLSGMAGLAIALLAPCGAQDLPVKGYETQMILDGPIEPGPAQTLTGDGAPMGSGIWVELWRVPAGKHRAESVASTEAFGGLFAFENIEVANGDRFYVTLSRSWQFDTDGDLEGWGGINDAILTVEDGILKVEMWNQNGDAYVDSFFQVFFDYDPEYYRVIEVRLKNTEPDPWNQFGIFWGAPWGTTIAEHNATMPVDMEDFETILIPMGLQEQRIAPAPVVIEDGLWATGALNNTIRIDPINNIPPENTAEMEGTVFEIDWIRIREDLRWDFHDDIAAIDEMNDIDGLAVVDGFLTYTASDVGSVANPGADGGVDPHFFRSRNTGFLDTEYFQRVAIAYENPVIATPEGPVGFFFVDKDSQGYTDDDGLLQQIDVLLPYTGRVDASSLIDDLSAEWSEDNQVSIAGLRLDLPQLPTEGDEIALDYFGFLPADPYGPSDVVTAGTVEPPDAVFIRGDTDGNGQFTIGDGVQVLERLFANRPAFTSNCEDTGDVDDNGVLTIGDAVWVFNYLFADGEDPKAPGPETCGVDPTDDDALGECNYPKDVCPK